MNSVAHIDIVKDAKGVFDSFRPSTNPPHRARIIARREFTNHAGVKIEMRVEANRTETRFWVIRSYVRDGYMSLYLATSSKVIAEQWIRTINELPADAFGEKKRAVAPAKPATDTKAKQHATDRRKKSLTQSLMDEHIHMPGFPQIIVTRGFAYQFLKGCGWSESERGYGSLDYAVFAADRVSHELTDEPSRDSLLRQVRDGYERNEAEVAA